MRVATHGRALLRAWQPARGQSDCNPVALALGYAHRNCYVAPEVHGRAQHPEKELAGGHRAHALKRYAHRFHYGIQRGRQP